MKVLKDEWERTSEDVVTINNKGEETVLNVPVEVHKKRKTQRVFIRDLYRAEQIELAKKYDLQPINLHEILLIYVDSRFFEGKRIIKTTYRFNKMLFYLWKRLEESNFRNCYIHDKFGSARAGPVPVNLKPSIRRLEKQGIVEAKWSYKHGVSSEFKLTPKGEEIAKSLWENIPDEIKLIYKNVKEELSLITPTVLRKKVHREYPEYKRTYTELDDEA